MDELLKSREEWEKETRNQDLIELAICGVLILMAVGLFVLLIVAVASQ